MKEQGNKDYSITNVKTTKIGRFRVVQGDVCRDGMRYPYSYLQEAPCVCVFPILGGEAVLIRQYRYAISNWNLEFPCGAVEEGEAPDAAAKRELFEETGCLPGKLIPLGECFARVGISDCLANFYMAECASMEDQSPDPTERIQRIVVPLDTLENMVSNGTFSQPLGIACWVRAKNKGCLTEVRRHQEGCR